MSFIIDASQEDLKSGKASRAYAAYIDSIKNRLPRGACEFAMGSWHYDFALRKRPHDAQMQEIVVREIAEGQSKRFRRTQIEMTLLGGADHRWWNFVYVDVTSHLIRSPDSQRGYGEWLVDEIGLSQAGLVVHQIEFSSGAALTVECRDILFREQASGASAGSSR